ncbi:hypothetical protein [Marmoricola sp. Leaf446]|uniref:hypothetical protein n=1 Tax=Marmoricola sp. Leaf446 TaxID=1736379 RepID=UPI0012E398B7|nr:hypothetical protein [Marmoricola sp. Leaf446]
MRQGVTLVVAVVFGAAAVWRLVGHLRGTVTSSAPDVVGTVLLTLLAVVLVGGAVLLRLNRYTVDDDRVTQQVGGHHRTLPLEPETEIRLRRELRGAEGAHPVWTLRMSRPGEAPIMIDQVGAPDFESVLAHVAEAGARHPELLADDTLAAVLDDPTLLDASAAEVAVAVDDVRRSR